MKSKIVEVTKSTNIKRFEHDDKNLKVTFRNDVTYEYTGVPVEIFEAFKEAESFGKFFLTKIKGNYPYKRL